MADNNDASSDQEPPTCEACGFEDPVGGVKAYPGEFGKGSFEICEVCANTYAGQMVTARPDENRRVLISIAWAANRIRKDVAEKSS